MNFLEADLEDLIHDASLTVEGRTKLHNRGLYVEAPLKRQVHLGSYGTLDLLELKGNRAGDFVATAYELKKGELKSKHLMQLCRYLTALKLHLRTQVPQHFRYLRVKGELIGRSVKSDNDFCFLVNETGQHISVKTYCFDMEDGLTFKESSGWEHTNGVLTDKTGFLENITSPLPVDHYDLCQHFNQEKQLQNGQK